MDGQVPADGREQIGQGLTAEPREEITDLLVVESQRRFDRMRRRRGRPEIR